MKLQFNIRQKGKGRDKSTKVKLWFHVAGKREMRGDIYLGKRRLCIQKIKTIVPCSMREEKGEEESSK